MTNERESTERTDERTDERIGAEPESPPPSLPEGAERAEYADYRPRNDPQDARRRSEEAEREAELQSRSVSS